MSNFKRYQFILITLIALVLVLVFVFWPKATVSKTDNDLKAFAACLTAKGITLYGVDTCESCQNQKKIFGATFDQINYINCDFQQKACQEKGFEIYPAWVYKQQVLFGFQTFANLAQLTGCSSPTP